MKLRVRALDFNYEEDGYEIKDVNARFEVTSTNGNFLNGTVRISREEYDNIGSAGLSEVETLVKAKLKEQIASL